MAAVAGLALRRLGPVARWAPHRAPFRGHRLTPADDEMYQRTRVTVLEPESANIMFIEGYSNRGFTISGDLVVGPCAVLPRSILQWNVGSHRDISHESLSLFRLLEPRIEILVLGTGDRVERLPPAMLKQMRACGIAVEVQDTGHQLLLGVWEAKERAKKESKGGNERRGALG
ncbi:NADH dehydrogenase [ubiquinone] 1 alpha subcomplex assembly factor 3 [Willisornis vidua]|uniref:NADH dehydrogenase [ubiquinone] 1 alpha subcomplex assembly factor 3 n=1 Tax=Willisornis vidua TaxID=1566151 RepID=A0ABQ9CPR1_9PASS|nr:NADH dehydrogenase [ubiquinone] 1 alpha subcomplex assembly factor 3 [Willisornis vidua]